MPFCKYCGQHVPESDGDTCEKCLKEANQEELPYPLLLAPPQPANKSKKSIAVFLVLAVAMGVMLFFFLLGRKFVS